MSLTSRRIHIFIVLIFISLVAGVQAHAESCRSLFKQAKVDPTARTLAVHLTDFLPENGILRTNPGRGRFGVTLHFSLGHAVFDHPFGNWSKRRYGIVVPFLSLEKQAVNVFPEDTFVLGDLRIPQDSVIFVPEGEALPTIPAQIVRYSPNERSLKDTVNAYIEESGSIRYVPEGWGLTTDARNAKVFVEGKDVIGGDGLKRFFRELLVRRPDLTTTTHEYTIWGQVDATISDLLAGWLFDGRPKVIDTKSLRLSILSIEDTLAEAARKAQATALPSEARKSVKKHFLSMKSYLALLRVELELRSKGMSLLATDFRAHPETPKNFAIASANRARLRELVIEESDHLARIDQLAEKLGAPLDPRQVGRVSYYATVEGLEARLRRLSPEAAATQSAEYRAAVLGHAFDKLLDGNLALEETLGTARKHLAALPELNRSIFLGNMFSKTHHRFPKIPPDVIRFYRSPEVRSLIDINKLYSFHHQTTEWMTLDLLFKSIMEPEKLKPVRNEGRSGVWHRDDEGRMWYLKPDEVYPELQTAAEVISSLVYRTGYYRAPYIQIVELGGKRYAAVEDLPRGEISRDLSEIESKDIKRLRIYSALLADWDRVRSYNSFIYDRAKGDFALFDFGGTLGARAMGMHKPGHVFSNAVGSFPNTRNFDEIYGAYRLDGLRTDHQWHNLSTGSYNEARQFLENLGDLEISLIVDAAKYSSWHDADYMKEALRNRRDALLEGLRVLESTGN